MNSVNSQQGGQDNRLIAMQKELRELAISDEINKRQIQGFSQAFHSHKDSIDKLFDALNSLQQALLKVFDKLEKINDNK